MSAVAASEPFQFLRRHPLRLQRSLDLPDKSARVDRRISHIPRHGRGIDAGSAQAELLLNENGVTFNVFQDGAVATARNSSAAGGARRPPSGDVVPASGSAPVEPDHLVVMAENDPDGTLPPEILFANPDSSTVIDARPTAVDDGYAAELAVAPTGYVMADRAEAPAATAFARKTDCGSESYSPHTIRRPKAAFFDAAERSNGWDRISRIRIVLLLPARIRTTLRTSMARYLVIRWLKVICRSFSRWPAWVPSMSLFPEAWSASIR
jgi:hypothetical protein